VYDSSATAESEEAPDFSDVDDVPLSAARDRLADLVDAVRDEDSFTYLTRGGKRAAEAHDRLASGEDELLPFSQVVAEAEGRAG
jgi:hypothetical protein